MTIFVSSCAANQRLNDAGAAQGQAAARVTLPDLPDDCRKKEPHYPLRAGTQAPVVIRGERMALDRQNARGGRCAGWYDDMQKRFR